MTDILDYKNKRVHMIGIGGSSMNGLAQMLLKEGYTLTGSDNARSHAVERLEKAGIPVVIGHQPANVHGADLLVYSAAILPDNPERVEAQKLGIPQMERSVLLGQLMRSHKNTVCVCGTHGKTTTSAMIGQALQDAGLDPTIHIGGQLDAIGGGTRVGGNEYFVAEACEFHGSFLQMRPTMAVLLNIDTDHLDCYKDLDDIENAFGSFLSMLPADGCAIGWQADERVVRRLKALSCPSFTFGMTDEADYYPKSVSYHLGCAECDVCFRHETLGHIRLEVLGEFNLIHALACAAAAHQLGADMSRVLASLSDFRGVHRRFEFTGMIDGARMYHDYGHNPAEMRAAIDMACTAGAGRVWAVMQPHTYSRVKGLFDEYLTCTEKADFTLVTDIYAAREKDPGDIRTEMLIDGMRNRGVNAVHTPTFDDTESYLRAHWQPGDLVLTMGCGNINLLNEQMQRHGDTMK